MSFQIILTYLPIFIFYQLMFKNINYNMLISKSDLLLNSILVIYYKTIDLEVVGYHFY